MISEPYLGKEECCKVSLFSSSVLQHLPFWTFHHHHMFWSILTNRSLELKKKYGRCQNNGHVFVKKKLNHTKSIWLIFEPVIVRAILTCTWFKKPKTHRGYGRKHKHVLSTAKRNLLCLLAIDWPNGLVFYSIKRDTATYGQEDTLEYSIA